MHNLNLRARPRAPSRSETNTLHDEFHRLHSLAAFVIVAVADTYEPIAILSLQTLRAGSTGPTRQPRSPHA